MRKFKADENLGFTQYGDVGPGTIGRLDELEQRGSVVPPEIEEGVVHPEEGLKDGPEPKEPHPPQPDDDGGGFGRRRRPPFFPPPFFSLRGSGRQGLGEEESFGGRPSLTEAGAQDRQLELREKRKCTGGGLNGLFRRLMGTIDTVVGLVSAAAAKVFHTAVTGLGALFGPVGAIVGGIVGYFTSGRVEEWVKNKIDTVLKPAKDQLFGAIQNINGVLFRALQPVFDFQKRWTEWFAFLAPYVNWAADIATWIRNTLARFKFKNQLIDNVVSTLESIRRHGDAPIDAALGCNKAQKDDG